jgi:hypothetical protein
MKPYCDGMSTGGLDPAGIYFGTRSGELFASTDEGKSWKMILSGLPPAVCLKSVVIGEPRRVGARKSVESKGASSMHGNKESLSPAKKRGKC